jgi:hypothetical protein
MSPRRNPHAVALGRKGGRANTPAQRAARLENISRGGRPRRYQLVNGRLERRQDGGPWIPLEPPYDAAAIAFLRRNRERSPRP